MGFAINTYVIDQDFFVLCKDVWDWMPDGMEFISCPRYGHSVFNNIFYDSEVTRNDVRLALNQQLPGGQWKALVRLGDVLKHMTEHDLSLAHRVLLQEWDEDLVLVIIGDCTARVDNFEEPSRSYGYVDPWYLRRLDYGYSPEHVYLLKCKSVSVAFYTDKECTQFLLLLATKNCSLEWTGPERVPASSLTTAQDETLDIPVVERVDSLLDWLRGREL